MSDFVWPEGSYDDIEAEIHRHMGSDGSDEANDWVTDLISGLTPHINRVIASHVDPVEAERDALRASCEAATEPTCATCLGREHVPGDDCFCAAPYANCTHAPAPCPDCQEDE